MSDEPTDHLLKEQNKQLVEQNEVLEKEIGYLRERLKETREYVAELEEEDDERNGELEEKDAQIKDFKKLIETQKAQIAELKEEVGERQETEYQFKDSSILKLKREIRELREKLEEKTAKIQGLKSVISELESEGKEVNDYSSLPEEFAEFCSIKDDSSEDEETRVAGKIARGFNIFSRIQNGKIGKNSFSHLKPNHQSTLNEQSSSSPISAQLPVFDESPRPSQQDDQVTPTFAELNKLIANDDNFDKIGDEIMANVVNQSGNNDGEQQFSNDNEHLGLVSQQQEGGEGRDSGIGGDNDKHGDHDGGNEKEEEAEEKREEMEEEGGYEVERQEEELEEQMGEEELEDTESSEGVKTTGETELEEEEESADPLPPAEEADEHQNDGPEYLHGSSGAADECHHRSGPVAGEQPPPLCFDRVQAAGRGIRRRLMRKMGAWIFMPLYRSINF